MAAHDRFPCVANDCDYRGRQGLLQPLLRQRADLPGYGKPVPLLVEQAYAKMALIQAVPPLLKQRIRPQNHFVCDITAFSC